MPLVDEQILPDLVQLPVVSFISLSLQVPMPGPGPASLRVAEPPISSILLMSRSAGQNLTTGREGLAQKSQVADRQQRVNRVVRRFQGR